jgi:hypothetical protein
MEQTTGTPLQPQGGFGIGMTTYSAPALRMAKLHSCRPMNSRQ